MLPVTIAFTDFVAVGGGGGGVNNMCCVAGDDSIHRVCCCWGGGGGGGVLKTCAVLPVMIAFWLPCCFGNFRRRSLTCSFAVCHNIDFQQGL